MQITKVDDLKRSGFNGIEETRFVYDKRIGGNNQTLDGLKNFVYFADALYLPFGESKMHSHQNIDVITVLLDGELHHEGSLQHGKSLRNRQIQVQRSGGEGFSHNEINPNASRTHILQIWAVPPHNNGNAAYKVYDLAINQLKTIYGGAPNQDETFDSPTLIKIGLFKQHKKLSVSHDNLIYIATGNVLIDGNEIKAGSLISEASAELEVISNHAHLTVIG